MILAINLNAALDRIYFIEQFVPETHMRTQQALLSIGGKGLCTARVLRALEAPHCALSFLAGTNGATLADLLIEEEICSKLIWVPGETREANVIVETVPHRHSHITTSGYGLRPEDCDQFLEKLGQLAAEAEWAIMAGTVPAGTPADFYGQIIELLHGYGVQALIDSSGGPLLGALPAAPEIVKMNQEELASTFKLELPPDLPAWIAAAREQVRESALKALVLTCGKQGMLAFTPQGDFHAGCEIVQEVNAAGAGDAVSAALVHSLRNGSDWKEALRFAAAAGAATVMTPGTAECHPEDIDALMPKAWVKEIL